MGYLLPPEERVLSISTAHSESGLKASMSEVIRESLRAFIDTGFTALHDVTDQAG